MSLLLLFNQASGGEPPPPPVAGKPRPSLQVFDRFQVVDLADSDDDTFALLVALF